MKYRWLASAVVLLAVACAPGGKKEKGTAAPTSEKPPVIATLKAPVAAEDIVWEEWAPTGVAAAKLDWPSGAAWARGKLCLVGSRRVAAPAGKKGVFAETVFYEVTPGGGREVAAYTNTFGESAAAGVTADPLGHLWVVGGYYTPPPIKMRRSCR